MVYSCTTLWGGFVDFNTASSTLSTSRPHIGGSVNVCVGNVDYQTVVLYILLA